MPATRRSSPRSFPGNTREISVTIPKPLLELFKEYPRIVLKDFPAGLWPIDPGIIRDLQGLEKVMYDKDFQEKFEIVIMPRGG